MPSFFRYELIYVENDIILVWMPSTGEWRTHKLMRQCGLDCPIINEDIEESGVWPQRKFHKLIFLGCHATTGHGHMLEIDPASGNYSVNMYEHATPDPMTKNMAQHHRLEMTEFQVVYMGKDEILMHDGNTQDYRIYLLEPRLPMSNGEDPIGPFEPLDSGKFALHEQVVYLGGNYALDYSAFTGEYFVHRYDRGATFAEAPFTEIVGRGFLDRELQITYLGNHQVLGFNPFTGKFKAYNMTDDMQPIRKGDAVAYYGFGSVLDGDICISKKGCRDCIAKEGCGWCDTIHKCQRGAVVGPCATNCTSWDFTMCPGEPCYTHTECSLCLHDPFCGWCSDSNTCMEGTLAGPLFGSCQFSKISCPVYVPTPAEEEKHCTEEIE
jgi:hypothetical protein